MSTLPDVCSQISGPGDERRVRASRVWKASEEEGGGEGGGRCGRVAAAAAAAAAAVALCGGLSPVGSKRSLAKCVPVRACVYARARVVVVVVVVVVVLGLGGNASQPWWWRGLTLSGFSNEEDKEEGGERETPV
jgi:hypothetical protein